MRVLDLFCGAGGLSYGFKMAGHEIVLGIDICQDACKTFEQNCGTARCMDMKLITPRDLLPIDIIVGGPPCQEFSFGNSERTMELQQVLMFIGLVNILKPKYYLMENVLGLRNKIDLGYLELDACDYAVPQHRKRLFWTNITRPKETHAEVEGIDLNGNKIEKWISVEEAIGLSGILEHGKYRGRDKELRIYRTDIPSPTLLTDNRMKIMLSHNRTPEKPLSQSPYFYNDQPSMTVTTMGIRYEQEGEWVPLEPEQLATLQSFPKEYKFHGKKQSVLRQIGNAVPPLLAYAFAKQIHP